jgi:SAM-dependent methyltransferase
MTAGIQDVASDYSLGTTAREYERVRRQAEVWQRATERVLDRVDPPPGARCLDAGCGPGVTMRQLAQRVGPHGRVVGLDLDQAVGTVSVERLRDDGHRQCEFRAHDLQEDAPIPGAPYDLAYARLVLFHLPDRVAVLRRLWEAVAPGGHLVVQDYDLSAVGPVPSLPAAEAVGHLIVDTFTAAGCEVRAGTLLPRLFTAAGVGRPDATDVAGRLDRYADAARMLEDVARSLLPAALDRRLVSQPESVALLARLRSEAGAAPERPFLWPLLLGAWKRKTP